MDWITNEGYNHHGSFKESRRWNWLALKQAESNVKCLLTSKSLERAFHESGCGYNCKISGALQFSGGRGWAAILQWASLSRRTCSHEPVANSVEQTFWRADHGGFA